MRLRRQAGWWQVFVRGGRDATGLDAVEWAARAAALGAGRTAGDLDRSRRNPVGLRHRPAAGDLASASRCRSWRRAARRARRTSSPRSVTVSADAVLAASIFHRRQHSIASVKAAMAAAGIPVRLEERRVSGDLEPRTSRGPPTAWCPAVVQDALDGRVLMLAWVDAEALAATIDDRRGPLPLAVARPAVAQGREQRQRAAAPVAWRSTATAMRCCSRSIPSARPATAGRARASIPTDGPAAGRGAGLRAGSRRSGRRSRERAVERPEGSYTVKLLDGGVDAVGRKVTEEATEVLLAAKDTSDREGLAGEVADLLYHTLVLLLERGMVPAEPLRVLRERHAG